MSCLRDCELNYPNVANDGLEENIRQQFFIEKNKSTVLVVKIKKFPPIKIIQMWKMYISFNIAYLFNG